MRVPASAPVTVVIPAYNRASLVRRAIDSVLAQSYAPVDVLVVDDGSTDSTAAVLRAYGRHASVRVIAHAENRGVAAAKNTGLDAVETEFTGILDSDDELLPDALQRMVAAFARLPDDVGMVFANCIDPATGAWTGTGLSESGYVTFRDALAGRGGQGEFWGLWRTAALGPRRFDRRLPGGESIVWHDMYRTTRVYYLHEAVRRYYKDAVDRVSRAGLDPARCRQMRLMYECYLDRFGADLLALEPRAYVRRLQALALWHRLAGERRQGLNRLVESVRRRPTPPVVARATALAAAPRALLRRALDRRRLR